MTTENIQTNETEQNVKANPPTHVAKVRHGYGKKASYERIGVAWQNEDGSFYIKLHGTQVVSAFTLYELNANDKAGG
ncbi:MAG: hypothetical protein ABW072_11720 [Sedimenticola sp.]